MNARPALFSFSVSVSVQLKTFFNGHLVLLLVIDLMYYICCYWALIMNEEMSIYLFYGWDCAIDYLIV